MLNKPRYFLIRLSKMLIDLGSIFGLDLHDRVLSFLDKKGLIAKEKKNKQ